MGAPWFQIRHMQESHGLVALSANFPLYGDLSDRMMSLVAGLGHRQEIYSIDESFVELSGIRGDLIRRGQAIRARVLQWVGIPCCIGIGTTKTLAKLANYIAKTAERKPGSFPAELSRICNLARLPAQELDEVLVSRQWAKSGAWADVSPPSCRRVASTPCLIWHDSTSPRCASAGRSSWNARSANCRGSPVWIWTSPRPTSSRSPVPDRSGTR